jgi:hypothetical protein
MSVHDAYDVRDLSSNLPFPFSFQTLRVTCEHLEWRSQAVSEIGCASSGPLHLEVAGI